MKSKSCLALAVLTLLIATLCILQPAHAQYSADGKAQYIVSPLAITSPINTTYTTNQVCLNFTVNAKFDPNVADVTITYSLDGKNNVTIPMSSEYVPVWITDADGNPTNKPATLYSYYLLSGLIELSDLSQDSHSLTVFARYDDYRRNNVYFDNQTIYFTIDTENFPATYNNNPATYNNNVDTVVSEHELPINTVYASVGIISLAAVVSFAWFIKRKQTVNM